MRVGSSSDLSLGLGLERPLAAFGTNDHQPHESPAAWLSESRPSTIVDASSMTLDLWIHHL